MRFLIISQGRKPEDHPGYHDGLQRLAREGVLSFYRNIPYIGFVEQHGYAALWEEIVKQAREHEVDAVYFQYYHRQENPDPRTCLVRLRGLPSRPTLAISCGDAFSASWMWPRFPDSFLAAASACDLTFMTQMGRAADQLVARGVKNVVLLPHALCQVRFGASCGAEHSTERAKYDVVWVGSKRALKPNVWNRVFWNGLKRRSIVGQLTRRYGQRFGLYGSGWKGNPSWQGVVPFAEQQRAFQTGALFVDAIPDPFGELYYASDRPFFALASGVPVLLFEKPGLDRIFRRNEHAYYVCSGPDLLATIDRLLSCDPAVLRKKAADAAAFIADRHTQYHRMRFVADVMRSYRTAKLAGYVAPMPELPFLLPEVDQRSESQTAIRNWAG